MKTYRYPSRSFDGSAYDRPVDQPTLEEIQLAEELRHRLELKLLSPADLEMERFGAQEYGWADAFEV